MKILALETSAKSVSVAVTEGGVLLAQAYQNRGMTHSVTLMPLLDGMLKSAGLTLDEIGVIAVAQGPGSFTGIRIGVAAAKGLAWAKEVPCCGVSTLAAMAYGAADFDGLIVGAMDARRQQVYNAVFRVENGGITRLCEDRAVSVEQVAQELKESNYRENILVIGDGASLLYDHLQNAGIACRLASPGHRYQSAAGGGAGGGNPCGTRADVLGAGAAAGVSAAESGRAGAAGQGAAADGGVTFSVVDCI